jgi:hypothetical protein
MVFWDFQLLENKNYREKWVDYLVQIRSKKYRRRIFFILKIICNLRGKPYVFLPLMYMCQRKYYFGGYYVSGL